jgi:hypothetical protein
LRRRERACRTGADLAAAIPGAIAATPRAAEDVPRDALDMSIAHDLASAIAASGHVDRHLTEALAAQAADDEWSVRHNLEHASTHVREISHHLDELHVDIIRRLPSVGRELDKLAAVTATGSDGRSVTRYVTMFDAYCPDCSRSAGSDGVSMTGLQGLVILQANPDPWTELDYA